MMKVKIYLSVLCMLLSSYSIAQVTIGSGEKPNEGALLDLKDGGTYSNGITAKKGMMLPRVELQDLKALTMGTNEIADNPIGTWAVHTGLAVYSISDGCVNENMMYPGVYIWDGTQWTSIYQKKEEKVDVRTITYNETKNVNGITVGSFYLSYGDENKANATYYYADYGEAGVWMTQSLRTKYSPDGTKLAMTGNQSDDGMDANGKPQKVGGSFP